MKNNFALSSKNMDVIENSKLYLFKKKEDVAVKKVEQWLRCHNFYYKLITPKMINENTIYHMLYCSDGGFSDLLVSKVKAEKVWQCHPGLELETITVQEMVEEILQDPYLLKSPILFDEVKLLAGFNVEEIRKFIPRSHRLIEKKMKQIN